MSTKPIDNYPQLGAMFQKAMTALVEGETDTEKQIVYVLREACDAMWGVPAFVAKSGAGFGLYVDTARSVDEVISVTPTDDGQFRVMSYVQPEPKVVDGVLALANEVVAALKSSATTILIAQFRADRKYL